MSLDNNEGTCLARAEQPAAGFRRGAGGYNGVTRATRIAKLAPLVGVEVIGLCSRRQQLEVGFADGARYPWPVSVLLLQLRL